MDRPLVPAGSRGTVVTTTMLGRPKKVFFAITTMLGRPKKVFFAISDGWGLKRFEVPVRRGDVDTAQCEAEASSAAGLE
jgi:hypothetical protein